MSRTIHLVALGCAKNQVDSERMLGIARDAGYAPVEDPALADCIVINTCAFIGPAKEESIDAILQLAHQRQRGRCSLLVVAGCLAQRYPDELALELPEVDHFIGTADLPRLQRLLAQSTEAPQPLPRLQVGRPEGLEEQRFPRQRAARGPAAYLKIAEGCDRRCAFCIIPALRGAQRSRGVDSLVDEARALVQAGARELNLVAQDTTAYGRDLEAAPHLVELLAALDGVAGVVWIRVLYSYPSAVDERLMEALAGLPRVVPYLDLPVQHVSKGVLRRMRRGYDGDCVRGLVEALRRRVPGIHLRTTLLTGHPGETDQDFAELRDFVRQARLEHLGVFPFSGEEGTDAASQPDPVPAQVALARAQELMELQRGISRERLRALRGRRIEVLVEGESEESEYLLAGRHAGQAPEVDGVVILADCEARPGELVRARVTDSADHDLVACCD